MIKDTIRIDAFLIMLCTLFVTSCSKDELVDIGQNQADEEIIQISAQIDPIDAATRANIGINGKGNFTEGDQITLAYDFKQQDLTLLSGKWSPAITWNDEPEMTFSSFYPALPAESKDKNEFTHEVLTDQHTKAGFEQSDLLFSAAQVVEKGQPVNLNFKHLMSCVTIVVEGLTPEDVEKTEVFVKGYTKIQVKSTGELGKLHDFDYKPDKVDNVSEIRMKYQGNNTFQAILCPQATNLSYGWWLKFKIGTLNKEYKVKEPPFSKIESGKNVTLKYRFKKLNLDYANKAFWVDGLGDMPSDDSSEWTELQGTCLKQLLWKPGDKWYDCNKRTNQSANYGDQNLCWAATASNMIHWWFDRNKDLVGEYCATNGIPSLYKNDKESEVFQVFKDSFTDHGSYTEQGLNWFFLGKYNQSGDMAGIKKHDTGSYFSKVLSTVSNMTENTQLGSLAAFDNALKSAFKNKQAIGFSVSMGGFNNASHAMTIWGAKFDESGKVCMIYYCDNNDGSDISEKPHLIAAKVKEIDGRVAVQGSTKNESYSMKITSLTMLNQKKTELKAYFDRQSNQ